MRQFLVFCVVLVGTFVVSGSSFANAADITATLSRMDAIIKEMQALRSEFASLAGTASTPHSGAVLGASTKVFLTKSLEVGETNTDIAKIQKLLATDKDIYPYGVSSGLFGPKTEEAIKKFQSRFNLNPVGVIGPATRALFELYFNAYPDDVYPDGVLLKKPTVLGIAVSQPTLPAIITQPVTVGGGGSLASITAVYESGNAKVTVKYSDGKKESFDIQSNSKLGVIDAVALKLGQKKAVILGLIEFTNTDSGDDSGGTHTSSEFDSITADIENGEAQISVEYANGKSDDFTVDEDKESKIIQAVAEELDVDEADVTDVIEFTYQDMDTITVDIKDGKALATVTFTDGTTKRIKVSSEDEDTIIKAVAKELGETKSGVGDIIEFN